MGHISCVLGQPNPCGTIFQDLPPLFSIFLGWEVISPSPLKGGQDRSLSDWRGALFQRLVQECQKPVGRTSHASSLHCLHSGCRKLVGGLLQPSDAGSRRVVLAPRRVSSNLWGTLDINFLASDLTRKVQRFVARARDPLKGSHYRLFYALPLKCCAG